MSGQPESLVLEMLRKIRGDISRVNEDVVRLSEKVETKVESAKADLRSEILSLRADVAADFVAIRKETSEQIVGLRRAVIDYHSAVLGHGMLISELEGRVRRMEQHLGLSAIGAG